MWRRLTDDEKDKLLKKFKSEGSKFNIMFFVFGIVTIFVSITLMEMFPIILLAILGFVIFKINIFILVILCLIASIPYGLFVGAAAVSTLVAYTYAMASKAKGYDSRITYLENNHDISICKTPIISKRLVHASRSGMNIYGITVRLLINDKLEDVEIKTGYVLEDTESVYVLAYKMEAKHMQIFKESDIELS